MLTGRSNCSQCGIEAGLSFARSRSRAGLIDNKLPGNRRSCYATAISITKYSAAGARKQLCKNENTVSSVQFQSAKRPRNFSLRVLYFVLIILHPVCKCKMECANWKGRVNGTLQRVSTRNFSPTRYNSNFTKRQTIHRTTRLSGFSRDRVPRHQVGVGYLGGRLKICYI